MIFLQELIILPQSMFKSMLGRVIEGLTNISPVKNLIKYILDRSLNELLSDQISLEDFKNGELHLSNISLNLDKINREYLLSSPYILHEGKVRRLKITLPGWSEISTKSIEVTAEGLQLDLKPNKQFYDNFKEAMRDQQMDIMQKEDPGEINEDNPMDFFRQLVKQIILNIRFRAENSVVRLFMNEPTKELASNKPQYYLMFRVPLLTLGRSEQVSAQKEDEEQIRFDLITPQMSLHLLRENSEFPEYFNQNASKDDFPFTYPPVSHPSTILVIGKLNNIEKVDCDLCTKLTLTLTTLFKKQKKFFQIGGRISHFQSVIDPIQLKIFTRFFAQIMQFQKILKSVMAEMGLNSLAPTLVRKESKGKSGNYDLFSSLMMSITQPSSKTANDGKLINDLMQSKEMTQAAEEFNQSAVAQLRVSGELGKSGEWKNINFKQETIVKFQLGTFQAHFPKYVSITPYERRWSAEYKYDQVNQSLGCSHYRLTLKGLSYAFSSVNNLHDVKMKFVKLQDSRLTNIQAFHHSMSEEFYELDSISFENTEIKQDYFTKRPELSAFKATKEQHYCMEELFRLSEGQQPQVINNNLKTYAFIPAGAQCGQGAGLKLSFNGHIKELKLDIKDVAVMVNFQIWKDVLNIIFPVHLYRKLNEKINLQSSQMSQTQTQSPKANDLLFQSQYRFSGNLMQQVQQKQQKVQIKVKIGLVYCFYRETSALKSKQNLFEEVERKILDSDNFSKMCFCNLNERGLYAEIHDLQWQQISEEFNLSIREIKAGLLSVEDSKVEADVVPILIADNLRVEESKVQPRKQSKSSEYILRSRTYLSKACFKVQLPALISFIDMAKKMVAVIESLQYFKKNLSAKLLIIEQEILNRPRVSKQKAKKERIVEVFVAEVELKMLLLSTYARSIFFSKQKEDQEITIDALAIGMSKKMDVRLGQFKNQMVTAQYPLGQKYKGIKDTHLILEIGRGSKQKLQSIPQSQNRPKRRIQRRLNFFEKIEKQKSSLWVIIKNKMDFALERKESKTFRFDKARKNSVIEQQKKLKEINVLPLEVYLHAGNMAFLLLHKKQIENTMQEVSQVFRQIQEQSKQIIEQQRRDSIQSEGQVTTQINLRIKDVQVNIDMKPDFKYDSESGLRILSNSRLFANIRVQQLDLTTNPDSSISKINNGLFSLSAHFLNYLDKDIETNPLLLNYDELQGLGFIKFLDMNELSLKVCHNARLSNLQISECGIDIIRVDLCLSTIPLIQLFMDHFVKHSLSGNYGGVEEEQFVVLDDEHSDEQLPEDLTEKLDQYNDLIELKKQTFNDFSIRQFSIRQSQPTIIALKHFKIGSIKMKLFGGNDFNFIQVNSLYESKANMRSRKENVDRMNFFSIDVINIRSKFQKNKKVSQVVLELEKMEVIVSFKRKEGLLWGAEKDCLVTLLKINMPLKVMAEISERYMMLKLSSLELTANLTDEILPLANQFSKAMNDSARSPWKKHYKPGKVQQSKMMILLILPEGRITASAQIKRAKLLNQRILKLPTLVVHEQGSNGGKINRIVNDWAMQIFTNNLGTLLTGALFELVAACIGLLLGGIKQFLALFFPSLNS